MIAFLLFLTFIGCSNYGKVYITKEKFLNRDKLSKEDKEFILKMGDWDFKKVSDILKDASSDKLIDLSNYIINKNEKDMNLINFLASKLEHSKGEKYSIGVNLLKIILPKLDPSKLKNKITKKEFNSTIIYKDAFGRNFLYFATLIDSESLLEESVSQYESLQSNLDKKISYLDKSEMAPYISFFTTPYGHFNEATPKQSHIIYSRFLIHSGDVANYFLNLFANKNENSPLLEGYLKRSLQHFEEARVKGAIKFINSKGEEKRKITDLLIHCDDENSEGLGELVDKVKVEFSKETIKDLYDLLGFIEREKTNSSRERVLSTSEDSEDSIESLESEI